MEFDAAKALQRPVRDISTKHHTTREFPIPEGRVTDILSSHNGELSLAQLQGETIESPVWKYWSEADNAWLDSPALPPRTDPLTRDGDSSYVWMAGFTATGESEIYRLNLKTGAREAPVLTDSRYDLRNASLYMFGNPARLVGIRFDNLRTKTLWLDERFKSLQAQLDHALPSDEDHWIVDYDKTGSRFVVLSDGPSQPGMYYFVDTQANSLKAIGASRESLRGKSFAKTIATRFTNRDGLELDAYLTAPDGASRDRPAPLVVVVNSDEGERSSWAFDAQVQALAAQGYGVLKINHRHSPGRIWESDTIWSEALVGPKARDIADGTRAALKTGIFDPKRVAIMGRYEGAYLAMQALGDEPALYRCAVLRQPSFTRAYFGQLASNYWVKKFHPETSDAINNTLGRKPASSSSVKINYQALYDSITTAVLIIRDEYADDEIVKKTNDLISSLKSRNIPITQITAKATATGKKSTEERIKFQHALLEYLERALKPAGS